MTKTIDVIGMTCSHCVASVKKALEDLPQVESAKVSLADKQAVVSLTEEVSPEVLTEAIEDIGFEVSAIR